MLMAVEVAVPSPVIALENVDSHVGNSGAVAGFSEMMLEAELRDTYCDPKCLLYYHEPRE